MIYLNALIPWFAMVILAIITGTIRQKYILPVTNEQTAHVIGTITFIIIQFLVIYFYVRIKSITNTSTLFTIGIYWVLLTVLFEFVFGHYVLNHSWQKLLADYNIFAGRLWILVLINNLVAPLISGKLLK